MSRLFKFAQRFFVHVNDDRLSGFDWASKRDQIIVAGVNEGRAERFIPFGRKFQDPRDENGEQDADEGAPVEVATPGFWRFGHWRASLVRSSGASERRMCVRAADRGKG